MKRMLWAGAVVLLLAAGSAVGQDFVFKPIDSNKLVVKPSQTAAGIAARSIDLVGHTAGSSLENNGWVKTINNLFSRKISIPTIQPGRSALPMPHLFPSTHFQNFNTPVMPTSMPRRR